MKDLKKYNVEEVLKEINILIDEYSTKVKKVGA